MEFLTWNLILRKNKYYLVHSNNIDQDQTETYPLKNEKVTFCSEGDILRGKVVFTSDKKEIIIAKLNEKTMLNNNLEAFEWFVIQFKSHARNVTCAVVNNAEIDWINSNGNDLYLINGVRAKHLFASTIEKRAYDKFNALKIINFDGMLELSEQHLGPNSPNWMLVQYSNGLNNFIYEVIEEKLCECKTDLIAYLRYERTIYQAKVLKRGFYFYDVLQTLENVENNLYARNNTCINADSLHITSCEPFDLIDFELMSIFKQRNVDYYYHHDGRMLDYMIEKADKVNEIKLEEAAVKIEIGELSEDCKVYKWLVQLQNS